jgi:GNAT superfamily N-acetyltransferase
MFCLDIPSRQTLALEVRTCQEDTVSLPAGSVRIPGRGNVPGHNRNQHLSASRYHPRLRRTITGSGYETGWDIGASMTAPMRIVLATSQDLDIVLGLIDEAADWLRLKGVDQWSQPWPDRQNRDARILKGLTGRKTWIVWHHDTPAATITMTARHNPKIWSQSHCECDLTQPAVYAHRLITARNYASSGLGAELINWTGLRARREYGAKWIRIDVWTTNTGLHGYYRKRGFEPCGFCPDRTYPSGALFQKPVTAIAAGPSPPFTEPNSLRRCLLRPRSLVGGEHGQHVGLVLAGVGGPDAAHRREFACNGRRLP